MKHPFINIQKQSHASVKQIHEMNIVHKNLSIEEIALNYAMPSMKNTLQIKIEKQLNLTQINSIDALENLYLEKLNSFEYTEVFNKHLLETISNSGPGAGNLLNQINKASMAIYKKCNRGDGNVVLLSSENEELLFNLFKNLYIRNENIEDVHGYKFMGKYADLNFFVSDKIPDDKIYIIYKDKYGVVDGNLFYLDGINNNFYHLKEHWQNYVEVIKVIKNKSVFKLDQKYFYAIDNDVKHIENVESLIDITKLDNL